MNTIKKHIGEGFGRGELYAALAYDSTDQFGGMCIKQVRFNPTSGATVIIIGDSSTALSYTAGTPLFSMYATNAGTRSTNAEPFYVKSTLTGPGGYGGRSRFHTYSNVASGSNVMALKSHMEFGDSGTNSGLAAAFCAELVMPNANTGSGGVYCVLELEYVAGGSSLVTAGGLTGNHASFIRATNSGDADGDFDDNGFYAVVSGLTAGADHLLSLTSQTLRCGIGTSTRYMVLSQTQDGLGLGTSGTPQVVTYNGTKPLSVYTTCASTNGSTSYEPVTFHNTLTGAGQVGGRTLCYMTTNVALGGWSNALKAQVVYGASGRTAGLGSALCVEMTMSAGTSSGTYAPLEIELNMGASGVTGTATSLMYLSINDAAATTFDTSGYLFNLQGLTAASGKCFQVNTAAAATHALRIIIGSTPYYIMLTDTGA